MKLPLDRRERELLAFVVLLLAASWLPVLLTEPGPGDALPEELLERPEELFPDIPGYTKASVSSKFRNLVPVLESDYIAAYTYTSESTRRPVWVLIQKADKPESFHGPKICYKFQHWTIVREDTKTVRGKDVEYLLVEREGNQREVVYWYFTVFEKEQKYFLFYLPRPKEIIYIRVETPYDEDAMDRVDEVTRWMFTHIYGKIEEVTGEGALPKG
ncbi:MAG: exosortase-associated EpsI family protein [Euryarchaeota archaeon]|nr:exosortase-associated EpsI family protein [Euryarchaeota archaeon]